MQTAVAKGHPDHRENTVENRVFSPPVPDIEFL
jgi:hypothetical protein